MSNDVLVIYDADPDGFGSAFAAWLKYGDSADYMEVLHGTALPATAHTYDTVFIFDLSFPYDVMKRLASSTFVTVIDHHPSSQGDIERLSLNPLRYDTTRAACVQVYEYFYPWLKVPQILQYVADRDTWTFALPDSEKINQFIYNTPTVFEEWDVANYVIENSYHDALKEGAALVRYRDKLVDEIADAATTVTEWSGYHNAMGIPFVAAPVLHSEVGHELLNRFPYSPFSITFSDDNRSNTRKYSLRSEDHRVDVGAFAKARGGGGHHNAAGFSKDLDEIWKEGYESLN